ncbi:MAG: hypothetical protein GY757_45320, partial [bacterium]|nr:hypothetical protein [bacterium]
MDGIGENLYVHYFKFHHVVIDGWGTSLYCQFIAEAYNNAIKNETHPDKHSFNNSVSGELAYIGSEAYKRDKEFWLNKYNTQPAPLFEPLLKPTDTVNAQSKNENRNTTNEKVKKEIATPESHKEFSSSKLETILLKRELYNRLTDFSKKHDTSVFYLFMGLIYTYFSRTTGEEDVVIGLPIANRGRKTSKQTIGLFIGISPFRLTPGRGTAFSQLLPMISSGVRQILRHQRFSVSEIPNGTYHGNGYKQQLFDITLSFEKHDYNVRLNDHNT